MEFLSESKGDGNGSSCCGSGGMQSGWGHVAAQTATGWLSGMMDGVCVLGGLPAENHLYASLNKALGQNDCERCSLLLWWGGGRVCWCVSCETKQQKAGQSLIFRSISGENGFFSARKVLGVNKMIICSLALQAGGPAGWPEQETTEMKRVWTWGTEKWSLMLQMMEICLLGSEGSFWKVTLVIDDDPQIPQRLCRTITEDDNLMANLTEKLQERSELLSVGDEAKTVGFFSNQRSPWDEQFMCWKIPSSAQKVRQAVSECWSSEMQHKAKRKRGQEESRVELQWRCSDGQGRAGFLPFPVSPEPCQRCLIHRGGFGYLGEVDCRKIQQGGDRGTSQSEKNSRWACSGTFLLHFIS